MSQLRGLALIGVLPNLAGGEGVVVFFTVTVMEARKSGFA
jgi:hypothetical protein